MAKIFITGAAGYVGSALARLLIQRNFDVGLIDSYLVPSNITSIENIPIQKIDIRDEKLNLAEYDVLFHLAALSGIRICENDIPLAYDINSKGTYKLLRTFRGRVIFASTSAVYGEAKEPTITEDHSVEPLGTYGRSKLDAEQIVNKTDSYCILRFSNIYGRGIFNKRTVIDGFIDRAIDNKPLRIHGDGRQRRDFIHISDVLVAYWQAMNSSYNGIYNVGGNEALSINDIAELCIKQYRSVFGYTLEKEYEEGKDCGRKWHDFIYSSDKAKKQLGYEPSYSVNDEIRQRFNTKRKLDADCGTMCDRKS